MNLNLHKLLSCMIGENRFSADIREVTVYYSYIQVLNLFPKHPKLRVQISEN